MLQGGSTREFGGGVREFSDCGGGYMILCICENP